MKYKIAILITTFLRDTLLYKTLQTIVDYCTYDCMVLIADQGYNSTEKKINIDYYQSQIMMEYYTLPFDSGLSMARNYLVKKANEMQIPYCLLIADSIQFIQPYNFQPVIEFLEQDAKRGLVGFDLENSKCSWEYNMTLSPKGIQFSESKDIIQYQNIDYKKVDICRNVFLAKTSTLIDLWDEDLKLGEHEMAFLEYKKRNYEVYWTNAYTFKRINTNASVEYQTYRKRLNDYLKLVKEKLGITGWVLYPKKPCK